MTAPARSVDELALGEGQFLRALWRFNHALERVSRRMEAVVGVTLQQRLIIRLVGKYPGVTSGQLAAYFHLDAGTRSASIHRLEGKGLVERRRAHRDKRRITLGLTAAGRRVDGDAPEPLEAALETLLGAAARPDAAEASRFLAALTAALERAVRSHGPSQ